MSNWWSTVLFDLYAFVGAMFSPEKLNRHIQTALTSWPLALVIVAVVFRRQLIKLISTMRRLSYKDGSREVVASWEEGLQELKEIEQATEAEKPRPSPEQTNDFDKLLALARVSSRSAVIEAWLSVENAARELVDPSTKEPVRSARLRWWSESFGDENLSVLGSARCSPVCEYSGMKPAT